MGFGFGFGFGLGLVTSPCAWRIHARGELHTNARPPPPSVALTWFRTGLALVEVRARVGVSVIRIRVGAGGWVASAGRG